MSLVSFSDSLFLPQSDFLVAFECGERPAFFELWDLHIPSAIRSTDPTCQHLEFTISVHFATYPLRKGVSVEGLPHCREAE